MTAIFQTACNLIPLSLRERVRVRVANQRFALAALATIMPTIIIVNSI